LATSGNHTDPSNGNTYQTFAITQPEKARAYYITEDDLHKNKKVHVKTALAWWELYCQHIPETTVDETHLIAGAVLPLWEKLKASSNDSQLRVVRVITEDNQRIVGVEIPKNRVQQILRALGIAKAISDPSEMIDAILKNDDQIAITSGFTLERGRVYGTNYVEIKGVWSKHFDELRALGFLNFSIDYKERFFLPTDPQKGVDTLSKFLTRYPADLPQEEPETAPAQFTDLKTLTTLETVNILDLVIAPEPGTTVPPVDLSVSPIITIIPLPECPPSPIPFGPSLNAAQLSFWDTLELAA
jgi:hypothetical protein